MSYVVLSSKKVRDAAYKFVDWHSEERERRIGLLAEEYIAENRKRIGIFKKTSYTREEAIQKMENSVTWNRRYHEAFMLGYCADDISRIRKLIQASRVAEYVNVSIKDLDLIYRFIKKD